MTESKVAWDEHGPAAPPVETTWTSRAGEVCTPGDRSIEDAPNLDCWHGHTARAPSPGEQFDALHRAPAIDPVGQFREARQARLTWSSVGVGEARVTSVQDTGKTRTFDTGATRDTAQDKLDFEGFLSPRVVEAYARYMNFNRTTRDGKLRDSDNWQKGFPPAVLVKSAWRHFMDWWAWHRGDLAPGREPVLAICGLLFNAMAALDQIIKEDPEAVNQALRVAQLQRDQERRAL